MEYGILFPAFGMPHLGMERDILSKLSADIDYWLTRAERIVDIDRDAFTRVRDGAFRDELQSQYSTYIYSCAMSDVLKGHSVSTALAAGFSMGIYAALYHAEALSFDDGLYLIRTAHRLVRKVINHSEFAMGTVLGLGERNLRALVTRCDEVELIGTNNPYCYVVSGRHKGISELMSLAQREGAFKAQLVSTSMPYHSRFVSEAAIEFADVVSQVEIRPPFCPVISCVGPRFLSTPQDIRYALRQNIDRAMNWLQTVTLMVRSEVRVFIECGAGKSLTAINRFIPGVVRTYNI